MAKTNPRTVPAGGRRKHNRSWSAWLLFCLLLLLLTAGKAEASELDTWEITGALGVLPPVSRDRSPLVEGIRAKLAARQLSAAARLAESLLRQQPASDEGYFWAGFVALNQKRFYHAVKRLRQAEKMMAPGNAVQKTLALAYVLLGQNTLFEMKIREAIALDGDDFAPHYLLGRFTQSEERNALAAIQSYRRALELRPDHYESLHFLGLALEAVGKLAEAEQFLQQATAAARLAGQTFSLPQRELSRMVRSRDPQTALAYAAQAVASQPDSADNHVELAKAYRTLGRVEPAVAALKAAIALDATQSSPFYLLASLYRRLGDKQAAEATLAEFQNRVSCYGKE